MLFNLLLVLFAYLPLQIALSPFPDIDLASVRIFILILFLLWIAHKLYSRKFELKFNLPNIFIIFFLFINTLSILAAKNQIWSARKILFLLSIFPVYFIATDLIKTKKDLLKSVRILLLSGLVVTLIGLGQFLSQFIFTLKTICDFWGSYITPIFLGQTFSAEVIANSSWCVNIGDKTYLRAFSLFPDPHMFSFYLGMLIPLAYGMFFEDKKNKFWLFVFSLFMLVDILTFSRGAYLGILTGAATFIFFYRESFKKKYFLSIFSLCMLSLFFVFYPNPVNQRLFSSFNLKEGSNSGRLIMWKKATSAIAEHPIIGVGLGNFPIFVKATAVYREPFYAHNTYLDIASETGLANALLWISIIGISFLEFYKKRKLGIIFIALGISLAIFAAHSMVDTAIYSPVVLTLLLIIISFSNIQENEPIEKNI